MILLKVSASILKTQNDPDGHLWLFVGVSNYFEPFYLIIQKHVRKNTDGARMKSLEEISEIWKKRTLQFRQHYISQNEKFLGQRFPRTILTKLFALFEPKNVKNHVTLNVLTPPIMIFEFSISNYPYMDQKQKKIKTVLNFLCLIR